ncbi:MAG TPA: bifunctional UDP-4-keto-pentose/UDP-xylose synthase, partial [Opitutaceae bacterium]|nr:bifunctional UDP-4-keto-pentose/UDP-xylose synthase [Opitutaceae bacterium]
NKNGCASRQIFNIGNPANNVSIAELAKIMVAAFKDYPDFQEHVKAAKIVSVPSKEYFGKYYQDIQNRVPSIAAAKKGLGWKPKVNLKTAIKLTLDYHLAHKDYSLD